MYIVSFDSAAGNTPFDDSIDVSYSNRIGTHCFFLYLCAFCTGLLFSRPPILTSARQNQNGKMEHRMDINSGICRKTPSESGKKRPGFRCNA